MLTQESYDAQRARLTRDIAAAQADVDAALARTDGQTDAKVHALKHDLASLRQARDDLDAAWRASGAERARARDEASAQGRADALERLARSLDETTHAATELQRLGQRYRELRSKLEAADSLVRRELTPFVGSIHERDALDTMPSVIEDGETFAALHGQLDLASLVRARTERIADRAKRLLNGPPTEAFTITHEATA